MNDVEAQGFLGSTRFSGKHKDWSLKETERQKERP